MQLSQPFHSLFHFVSSGLEQYDAFGRALAFALPKIDGFNSAEDVGTGDQSLIKQSAGNVARRLRVGQR